MGIKRVKDLGLATEEESQPLSPRDRGVTGIPREKESEEQVMPSCHLLRSRGLSQGIQSA